MTLLAEREFQADWARAFGHLPARRDLLAELDLLFETDWQFTIARIAKRQALDRGRSQPATLRWRNNGRALVATWREMCVEQHSTDPLALGIALEKQLAAAGAAEPGGGRGQRQARRLTAARRRATLAIHVQTHPDRHRRWQRLGQDPGRAHDRARTRQFPRRDPRPGFVLPRPR